MSVGTISGSTSTAYDCSTIQQQRQQFAQEFQQLGTDLQTGNLTAAQADFATLQSNAPPGASGVTAASSPSGSTDSISSGFNQLSQDLKAGNLTAAQQDYSNLAQALQSHRGHHRHHHHHDGAGGGTSGTASPAQEFQELGQDLQSGNTAAALKAYNSLKQFFGTSNQTPSTTSTPSTSGTA